MVLKESSRRASKSDRSEDSEMGSQAMMQETISVDEVFVDIWVDNPVTCHRRDGGKYTLYEITVKTNNIAFSLPWSCVKRRYSEFVWLRSRLVEHHPNRTPPPLPPKKFFGNQFSEEVIESRRDGLRRFLQRLLDEMLYLSDSALHLFLQTELATPDMDLCMEGKSEKGVLETILEAGKGYNSTDNTSEDTQSERVNSESISSPGSCIAQIEQTSSPHVILPITQIQCPFEAEVGRINQTTVNDLKKSPPGGKYGSTNTPNFGHIGINGHGPVSDSLNDSGSWSSCDMDSNTSGSVDAGGEGKTNRKKSVTFSPQVTVAEVMDRVAQGLLH